MVPPRVTVRAGRDELDVAPGLTGATSESSSHRLPSVKSAPCRSVSASANDHRLLTQTCDASPYRGMLRVGAWCSNRGTPAGRTKLLLRFGLGLPVFPCTRSTPCRPRWQGPPCAGSRTRLRTSFALFSALMAGTRLRGDHGRRGVVRGRVGEEGVVIGGLRRAGAWRRAGSSRVLGIGCGEPRSRHRPSHIVVRSARPRPRRAVIRRTRPTAGRVSSWTPRTGVGASSRDGYLRPPSPGSGRAAGRVGVSHATARPSGAPGYCPLPGDQHRAGSGGHHQPARTPARMHDGACHPSRTPAARSTPMRRANRTLSTGGSGGTSCAPATDDPNPIPPPQPPPRRPGSLA